MTLEEAMELNPEFVPEEGVVYSDKQIAMIASGKRFDSMGRPVFCKGHSLSPGRKKGSRNKLTQEMLDRIANGVSPDTVLIDIYMDDEANPELRYKAASKMADILYPKASSVEVIVDEKDKFTKEQVEDKIKTMLPAILADKAE